MRPCTTEPGRNRRLTEVPPVRDRRVLPPAARGPRGGAHRRDRRGVPRQGRPAGRAPRRSGSASPAALAPVGRRRRWWSPLTVGRLPIAVQESHRGDHRAVRGRGPHLDAVLDAPAGPGDEGRAGAGRRHGARHGARDGARGAGVRRGRPRGPRDRPVPVRDRRPDGRPRSISTLIGAAAGLAVAVAIGYAIFRLGVRIDLRRFFTFTGVDPDLRLGRAGRVRDPRVRRGRAHRQPGRRLRPQRRAARDRARSARCWPGCSATAPRRRRSRSSGTSGT